MTEKSDIASIRKSLKDRRDILTLLDDGDVITGFQLRRTKETHVQGADSYHPHTYIGWLYYGQPFAIDANYGPKKKLSAAQKEFKEQFEAAGGIYLWPSEVRLKQPDGLGDEPADIDKWLARENNRVPLRLSER